MLDCIKFDNRIVNDTYAAATVSLSTIMTGVAMNLDWIPDDIGKLAAVVGIFLSLVLIYLHVQKVRKINIEIEMLKKQNEDE